MRRLILTLVSFAAAASSGSAVAQSTLTMFGVVDTAIQHIKGGDAHVTRLSSGALNGSRLGFKGVEDLGGGLSAAFHLEAGLNTDSGSGRRTSTDNVTNTAGQAITFNRRSTVGLKGGFGEVRLGRDYTPVADNHTDYDVFGNSGIGDSSLLTQALAIGLVAGGGVKTDVRASNSIGYFLPGNLGGIFGYAMHAVSETANGSPEGYKKGDGAHTGARIGYENGGLNVAVAYGKTKLAAQSNLDNIHVGAWYRISPLQLFGQMSRERTRIDGQRHVNDAASIGAIYVQGVSQFKVEITRSVIQRAMGEDSAATMFALGYQYDLSKRTALHGAVSFIRNNDRGIFDLAVPVRAGQNASGVQVGVRHRF